MNIPNPAKTNILLISELFFMIFAAIAPSKAAATLQTPDLLTIDGNKTVYYVKTPYNQSKYEYSIRCYPLNQYFKSLSKSENIPRLDPISTACKRGYVARWQIKNGELQLISMERYIYKNNKRETKFIELSKINKSWKSPVTATWFTGKLNLVPSDVAGQASMPPNIIVEIKKGKVCEPKFLKKPCSRNDLFERADLPIGGKFTKHPIKSNIEYYLTNRYTIARYKSNTHKLPGLYISNDNGKTWKLLSDTFEITNFFVHPKTGKLYCIIRDEEQICTNEKGFLTKSLSWRCLMSDNGKQWKDITTKKIGGGVELLRIFADPDNANRICLGGCSLRPYIFQATDDNYSKWTMERSYDWYQKHPKKKTGNSNSR